MGNDFSPGEAWNTAAKLELLRKYGPKSEVDKREHDKRTMELVQWAREHPQKSPLSAGNDQ